MLKKIKNLILIVILAMAVFAAAHFALAAVNTGLNYAAGTGLSAANDPRIIAANIIRIALGFLGIVAVGLIMYAGWLYMTANGEAEKVEKAKKILIGAVIGLLIILASFAIASYILSKLTEATGGGGDGTVCSPACGSGEYCCKSACQAGPCSPLPPGSGPDVFAIAGTIPRDQATSVIRNVRVRIFFNDALAGNIDQTVLNNNFKAEKIADIDPASGAETALTQAQTVAGAVTQTSDRREINFKSNAACGDEKNTANCFASWSKYKITVDAASGLKSIHDQSLSCAGNACEFVFSTNNLIDTSGPTAGIVPQQICRDDGTLKEGANTVTGWGRDDVGISQLVFYSQKQGGSKAEAPAVPGTGQLYQSASYLYDTKTMTVGEKYDFGITAYDLADQQADKFFTTTIRPGHCCNGKLDKDLNETDIDCGGACGACDGAACATDIAKPGICSDSLCASQTCRPVDSAAKCSAAGYAAGTASCCLCQRPPVITGISPVGGFCKNEADKVCLKNSDCASGDSCDTETPNGAAGNFFTIYGINFGASTTPGQVYASSTAGWIKAELANNAAAGGNAQCKNVWSDNQITAIVPAGAQTGAVKVEKNGGLLYTTSDKNDVPDFKINNIVRPGLCSLDPNQGKIDDTINYYGIKMAGSQAYYGDWGSKVLASNSNLADQTGTAQVPNLQTGQTSSFVAQTDKKVYSNYLEFYKTPEPYTGPVIISFEPNKGKAGQYVTIRGSGFGNIRGSSQVFFGDKEASYVFPVQCMGVWSDKQVIVKVPDSLSNADGDYKISLVIPKADGTGNWTPDTSELNPSAFTVNNSLPLAPNLCDINPDKGQIGSAVVLYGENFGEQRFADIKFQPDKSAVINYWGKEGTADKATTTVPLNAVSGQVRIVQTSSRTCDDNGLGCAANEKCVSRTCQLASNPVNFSVGLCAAQAECGDGSVCCPDNSPYKKTCRLYEKDASGKITESSVQGLCFSKIKTSVYEWDFNTGGAGVGEPCYDGARAGICDLNRSNCSKDLVCEQSSCVCKKPCNGNDLGQKQCKADNNKCDINSSTPKCNKTTCLCECTKDSDCKNYGEVCNTATGTCTRDLPKDSCSGYGTQCADTYFCPNSPGQCSTSPAGTVVTGDCDYSCNSIPACKGDLCRYDDSLNKCVAYNTIGKITSQCIFPASKAAELGKQIEDVNGQVIDNNKVYCDTMPGQTNGWGWWYFDIDKNTNCPPGWNKTADNKRCVDDYGASNANVNARNGVCLVMRDINNKSILGKPFYCAQYSSDSIPPNNFWHLDNIAGSCPDGWIKAPDSQTHKNQCVDVRRLSGQCFNCESGFSCVSANYGTCVANAAVCPSGSVCNSNNKCTSSVDKSCQCCCRKDNGGQDCCVGLSCQGSCGSGANFGLCTGCTIKNSDGSVNQSASNDKCNCAGTSGKFCDIGGASGAGTCKDCAQLSTGQLCSGLGEGSCCVDAAKSDACRGITAGGGIVPKDTAFKEVYSENFDKDGDLAGWQPTDCAANYEAVGGHLDFHATVLNDCPFDIKHDYKFIAGDSYKITIKALTNLGSFKFVAKLSDGADFLTAEAAIPPYNIPDQEYTLDFPALAKNFSQLEFYQVNRDGKIIRVSNGADSIDYIKIAKKTDYAFCAYYSCGSGSYADQCQADSPQKTGTYRTKDCGNNCVKQPHFGETCFKVSTSTKNQICDTSICENFFCINEDGSGPTPPNSCGTCCCDPKNDNCASLNSAGKPLKCQTNKGSCSGANRGLCCGCSADSDCGSPETTGCGADACCDGRPTVTPKAPADGAKDICRNSLIQATFNRQMSLNTFSGNVIVAGKYDADQCPANTTYLTAVYKPTFFAKLKFWLAKLPLLNRLFADAARADAVTGNFCAIKGTVNGYNNAKTATMEFAPAQILEPNREYYVIIKGDTNITDAVKQGVLSAGGISLNPVNNITFNGVAYQGKIWSFTTKDASAADSGICLLNSVTVNPDSWLFNVLPSDKTFSATASSTDGQLIAPISGVYNWSWSWTIDNQAVVKFKDGENGNTANRTLIAQNVKDDSTLLHAKATITEDTASKQSTVGAEKQGQAEVYVFICSNPWPAFKTDGSWQPWRDVLNNCNTHDPMNCGADGGQSCCYNTNYELHYCRDAGGPGTANDLPAIQSDSAVIRPYTSGQDILKEFYFFREGKPLRVDSGFTVTPLADGGAVQADWAAWDQAHAGLGYKYKLHYGEAPRNYAQVIDVGNDHVKQVTGLTNNKKYYFAVTVYNAQKAESDYSAEVMAVPADTNPPKVISPVGFTASPGDRAITLRWAANTDDTVSYVAYYGASSDYGSSVTLKQSQCAANSCTAAINNLANGVRYYFGVAAVDGAGNKSAVNTASDSPSSAKLTAMPFAPAANLTLVGVGNGLVKLSWSPAQAATGYKIYYNQGGDAFTDFVAAAAAGTAANPQIISGLANGTTYYFAVKSVNNDNVYIPVENADYSNKVNAMPKK